MKLVKLSEEIYAFRCPGCRGPQKLPLKGPKAWEWNGSMDRPTIKPSILSTRHYGEDREKRICHSYVTDGRIQFLNDCTHALAGQTVELPEVAVEADLFYNSSEIEE